MGYEVVYEPDPRDALDNIERYLSARSPASAKNVLADIKRTVEQLGFFPHIGTSLELVPLRHQITRRYKYRIVYDLGDGIIRIINIYHPRQLPEDT